jgi:hypothetical protein
MLRRAACDMRPKARLMGGRFQRNPLNPSAPWGCGQAAPGGASYGASLLSKPKVCYNFGR